MSASRSKLDNLSSARKACFWAAGLILLILVLPKGCSGCGVAPKVQSAESFPVLLVVEMGAGTFYEEHLTQQYTQHFLQFPSNKHWHLSTVSNDFDEPIRFQNRKGEETNWVFPGEHLPFGSSMKWKVLRIRVRSGTAVVSIGVDP